VRWRTGVGGESPYSSTDRRFVGSNPPRGVSIDYALTKPAKEVSLKVLDVNGKIVRAFTSPKKAVGFHRVQWDLSRGTDAARSARGQGQGASPLASGPVPQGAYRVLLVVDGVELSHAVTVELDPNAPKDTVMNEEAEWEHEPANPLKPKKVIPWPDR
jgi:hypothetical protein